MLLSAAGVRDIHQGLDRELCASDTQSSLHQFCKAWSAPHALAGDGELVVLFHDGSRGDHGVAGAATLAVYVPGGVQKSKVLTSLHRFSATRTSAAGGEYFALLLGLAFTKAARGTSDSVSVSVEVEFSSASAGEDSTTGSTSSNTCITS